MPTRATLKTPLTNDDAIALKRHLSGSAYFIPENLSPLVKALVFNFPADLVADIINSNVDIARQVFAVDPRGAESLDERDELLMRFRELEDLPLPPYAVDRYPVYEKGVNLLYGLPGIGKSFIALDFIGHLAVKHPDKSIVYIAPEGWSSIPVRWEAWCKHYRHDPQNTFIMRHSLRLNDPNAISDFKVACENTRMKVHFIVIDTLARAMTGDNENDTREMNLFIDSAERLRADLDCGILFVHHVNKQGLLRGSTVLEGALDSMIKVQKDDTQLVLFNSGDKGGKNRHREEAAPVYLNFVQVEVTVGGITDHSVVIELGEKVIQTPSKDTLTRRQREMLEALDGYDEGLSVKQIEEAASIPKPTIYRYAKLLQQAGYLKHDKEKDRLMITSAGKSAYRG